VKKLFLASVLGASLCSFSAFADQMSGYISDSHCGAAHNSPSAANTQCIEKCLKGGSDPVLVSDGKVVKLDADSKDKARAYAGKNVTVSGSMDGDVLKINTISEAESH
jgi:hypothetical protein